MFSYSLECSICSSVSSCKIILDACTSLTSVSRAFHNAEFGEGTGAVYLEGLECVGNENTLFDCHISMDIELGLSQCDHSQDVGIKCYGTFEV